ncbi:MAG: hypothetical protein M0R06_01245 [Sphaerochaeta sp.]|jgi:hypothetical protein|nr:hypothetical protein [Sphaerochaeta sp.]
MAVTKSDMEQLLVELGPVPQLLGQLSDHFEMLKRDRQGDRESQIRTEESLKSLVEQVKKINGSVANLTQCAADNKSAIKVHDERLNGITKALWSVAVPTLLMLVKVAFDLFAKGNI